jgi:beta-D-xylosidase 4
VPASYQTTFNFTQMNISTNDASVFPGRTYRWYSSETAPVLWDFGFGLSYTTFELAWAGGSAPAPVVLHQTTPTASFNVSITIANTGAMDGGDVLQVYWAPPAAGSATPLPSRMPLRQLFWFTRINIAAGATSAPILVPLRAIDFEMTNDFGNKQLFQGNFTLILSRGIGVGPELTLPVQITY